MTHCVGLNVSQHETAVCIVDEAGKVVFQGKDKSELDALIDLLRRRAPNAERVGLDGKALSSSLWPELMRAGLAVVSIDAWHARDAPSTHIKNSDENDARALAELARVGWHPEIKVKSETA
ncbi:IS110 family transposase [Rhizobium rhizogenes]|jgi:hypothetical protein